MIIVLVELVVVTDENDAVLVVVRVVEKLNVVETSEGTTVEVEVIVVVLEAVIV